MRHIVIRCHLALPIVLIFLAPVMVKCGHVKPVEYLSLHKHLIEVGTLSRGDIFVLNNCSIHIQSDNCCLCYSLMTRFGIKLVTIPPYHPELNPTKLVFNTLLMRSRSAKARYSAVSTMDFKTMIEMMLDQITIEDVIQFYNFYGY